MGLIGLNYLLICLCCYLVGSIPFSYIIVKKQFNIDILQSGSGNAGAMNSYEVTNSKKIGLLVLLLDFLKGLFPSIILVYFLKLPMKLCIIPSCLIVFGHNFSIWLKLKGGRGLATSAGIYVAINFLFVIIWMTLYLISYIFKKNVHIANTFATIILPVIIIIFKEYLLKFNYNFVESIEYSEFFILFSCLISLIILLKHIEPVILYFKKINKV